MNTNPSPARKAKRVKRKAPSLENLLLKLWKAVETADELLNHDDPEIRLRAVHALSQTGSVYAKTYEVGELEGRLKAIEEAIQAGSLGPRLSQGAA